MNTVELFSGTKSFSKVAKEYGYSTFTVDIVPSLEPDKLFDLSKELDEELKGKIIQADVVWMSPPCQTFSMAAGNTHWDKDRNPKTENAKLGLLLLRRCEEIANYCIANNKIFFIENPVARARWFLPEGWRKTCWYCQYSDKRAKPTDIWTNLSSWNAKACKNNNPDCHHERAPRGSKTGTQGLKGAKERGHIPPDLFKEIFLELTSRQ